MNHPASQINRRSWLGVVIGLIGVAMLGIFIALSYGEVRQTEVCRL